LVVKGYEDKGKILPVNLRNRPQTPREKEPTSRTGAEIGRLEPGTVIKRAIAVFGNDPFSLAKSSEELMKWVAFPHPENPKIMVFAYKDGFSDNPKILRVAPFEVRSGRK